MSRLITISDGEITLANEHIHRVVRTSDGPATIVHNIRPDGAFGADLWLPAFKPRPQKTPLGAQPLEASVTIGGKLLLAGPFDPDPNQMHGREGAFDVVDVAGEDTDLGEAVTLTCRGREGREIPVELRIRYEIARDLPLMIKQVTVVNISDAPVTIDNVAVEMVKANRLNRELNVFTDWYDRYRPSQYDDDYYRGWTRFEFPGPIGMVLAPGGQLTSFRVFEYVAPNDPQARAVAHHRVFKRLAPWVKRPRIGHQVGHSDSVEELIARVDAAADDGIEALHLGIIQLHDTIGDYDIRRDVFPNGEDDVRRVVDRAHQRGLYIMPYMGLTIAWEESKFCQAHGDWRYLGPDGMRYKGWGHGNMCYQSPWGDFIREKIRWVLDDLGFDGMNFDGPYHGLPCLETHHAHPTPEAVPFMNWDFERKLFGELAERGAYVSTAQDAPVLLLGARLRPGGYTEEDMAVMGGMPMVTAVRTRLYDARYELPSCCCYGWVGIEERHTHSMQISEQTPENYDFALGGCFGYGHPGVIAGSPLHSGPKTKEIFDRWMRFYKDHRDTLSGEMIHLARPDGKHGDACMHVNPDADPPAVIVAFNPGDGPVKMNLPLPLGYAGFGGGLAGEPARNELRALRAEVEGVGDVALDERGIGFVTVDVPAGQIRTLDVRAS